MGSKVDSKPDMENISPEKKPGCGLFGAVFGRRQPRRSTSFGSVRTRNVDNVKQFPGGTGTNTRKDSIPETPSGKEDQKQTDRIVTRPGPNYSKTPRVDRNQGLNKNGHHQVGSRLGQVQARKVPQTAPGISGELETMIQDHQKSNGPGGNLIRASSSNVMLLGNLGNLRQPGNNGSSNSSVASPARAPREEPSRNGKYSTSVMGNVVKKNHEGEKHVSFCRALSTRMDPEQLKILGNEDYKNGRFAEAVALYDAAIAIDPNKASYRSNKSAALAALGKVLEAAFECREAIQIDPFYQRAHNRLATIYVRLGEAEKAMYHFKQAGSEADPDAMNKAKQVQTLSSKCTEAKRHRDWNTLIRDAGLSMEAGADSAPLIYALKAEALLKMNRHEEAIKTMKKCPDFDIDDCTRFFGPNGSASLLVCRAQVHMVAGRFEDAVAAAEQAMRLDPSNNEASKVLRRTRAVAKARQNGNELYKAARYSEACIAYGEGLNHDPCNAVLLGNRAACKSKLGHYEKAMEDCNAALSVRPSYSKARLRRADCCAKLGKWRECVQDCELLMEENPNDEEVLKLLQEAKAQGGKQEESSVVAISRSQRFRDCITSQGTSVVLFCNKPGDSKILHHMEKLKLTYPKVKFLKVEVEDHTSLPNSEGVTSLPTFIIYKNGSRAKQVSGDNFVALESTIKYCISS